MPTALRGHGRRSHAHAKPWAWHPIWRRRRLMRSMKSVAVGPLLVAVGVGGVFLGTYRGGATPAAGAAPQQPPGGPGEFRPRGGFGPGGGPEGEAPTGTGTREIMRRLGRGPTGLTAAIGEALKADAPAWPML